MKPDEVVLKGGGDPPEPTVQPSELPDPALDALRRDGYLTMPQAVAYGGFPSRWALYKWVTRSGCRTYRRGARLLFKRRDIDEALKPAAERGRRHFFGSVKGEVLRRRE